MRVARGGTLSDIFLRFGIKYLKILDTEKPIFQSNFRATSTYEKQF